MIKQHIQILDTTLRDGQQCPGAGLSFEKNLEYARLAAEVGVDILEAGFPAASKTDFMIVDTISQELAQQPNSPVIAALCQLREQQIEITLQALSAAKRYQKARIHVYVPVDPALMQASLGAYAQQQGQIVEDVYRLLMIAAKAGYEIEFTAEGYSRLANNFDFTTDLIRAAIAAGATIINCPDTIGGACKLQGDEYFVTKMQQHDAIIKQEFPDKTITWSVHCHNDFGLALENSMNAVFSGPATQIEGCFNGIGERAGNVSLEQCIMYLKQFGSIGNGSKTFFTKANSAKLQTVSDFIGRYMLPRQPHWPITGDNAAKHSSGGHTNAVIKNPLAYQPFDPKEVGNEISLLFGPLSGGNHAKTIIEKYGYRCDEQEKAAIGQFIKDFYPERRKGITDQELLQAYLHYRKPIKATQFSYSKEAQISTLKITGQFFEHVDAYEVQYAGEDSALAALYSSIKLYLDGITIENYQSQSASAGIGSKSQSKIVISDRDKNLFNGTGEDQDIEISALKALVDACNQAYIRKHYQED